MTDAIENGMLLRPACSLERFVCADIKDQILVIWVPTLGRHAGRFESMQRVKESTTSEMSTGVLTNEDYHTKHFIIPFTVTCHASCHVTLLQSRAISLVVGRGSALQITVAKTFFVTEH
jgi:hypothetical protein